MHARSTKVAKIGSSTDLKPNTRMVGKGFVAGDLDCSFMQYICWVLLFYRELGCNFHTSHAESEVRSPRRLWQRCNKVGL